MLKITKILNYLNSIGFKILPCINTQYYLYKDNDFRLKHCFSLDVAEEETRLEDIYVYGWAIEIRCKKNTGHLKKNEWYNQWNHRIYSTKEAAIDAINQMKVFPTWNNGGNGTTPQKDIYDMRVIPLYNFKNNGFRNHMIAKILKEK